MESKLLHKTTELKHSKVLWEYINGSEWVSFKQNNEIDFILIYNKIEEFLTKDEIYLVWERNNSGLINYRHDKMLRAFLNIGNNFSLWNLELTKTIEFNRIGVFKCGSIK